MSGGYMFNKDMKGLWRWNLFWWKVEGMDVLNGINVYHPDDPSSAGFVIKVGAVGFRIRYSKRTKQWFGGFQKYDPKKDDPSKFWLPFAWSLNFGTKGIQATEEHDESESGHDPQAK